MNHLQKVVELAQGQHGVFARFQLSGLEIPTGSYGRVIGNKLFERVGRGVYIVAGSPDTWGRKAAVAVYGAGPAALLSHVSALMNLDLLSVETRFRGPCEYINVTSNRETVYEGNIRYHRTIYKKELYKSLVWQGIPQVSAELAIIDSARMLYDDQLSNVLDKALRLQLTNVRSLRETLAVLNVGPGREKRRLRELLDSYHGTEKSLRSTGSVLEMRVLRLLKKHFRTTIVPQFEVLITANRYRIDFALPEYRLAIEVDGFEFHRSRHNFDADRMRQNALVNAGWTVLRFTSRHSDDEIVSFVRSHLSRW